MTPTWQEITAALAVIFDDNPKAPEHEKPTAPKDNDNCVASYMDAVFHTR